MPTMTKPMPAGPPTDPRVAFNQAWQKLGPQAEQQGSEYWRRISGFDPSAALNTYARGAASEANKYLTETLDRLRGQSVGAGRLDTGFYDTSQGEIVRDVYRNLNEQIAQQALGASGQNLQAMGQMGSWAGQSRQDYLDLLSGELDRRTAEKNAKSQSKSSFWGALGQIGGAVALAALL